MSSFSNRRYGQRGK